VGQQNSRRALRVERIGHAFYIRRQIRLLGRTARLQVDRGHVVPLRAQQRHQLLPAPGAVPAAVHQHEVQALARRKHAAAGERTAGGEPAEKP
jgi:hypothetical protein